MFDNENFWMIRETLREKYMFLKRHLNKYNIWGSSISATLCGTLIRRVTAVAEDFGVKLGNSLNPGVSNSRP